MDEEGYTRACQWLVLLTSIFVTTVVLQYSNKYGEWSCMQVDGMIPSKMCFFKESANDCFSGRQVNFCQCLLLTSCTGVIKYKAQPSWEPTLQSAIHKASVLCDMFPKTKHKLAAVYTQ